MRLSYSNKGQFLHLDFNTETLRYYPGENVDRIWAKNERKT